MQVLEQKKKPYTHKLFISCRMDGGSTSLQYKETHYTHIVADITIN